MIQFRELKKIAVISILSIGIMAVGIFFIIQYREMLWVGILLAVLPWLLLAFNFLILSFFCRDGVRDSDIAPISSPPPLRVPPPLQLLPLVLAKARHRQMQEPNAMKATPLMDAVSVVNSVDGAV